MLGIEFAAYVTYVLACIAIVLAPGPTLTVIVANSLRHGPRAGIRNVADLTTKLRKRDFRC